MSVSQDGETVAFRGARKVIATRMMQSLHTSAQLTFQAEADITALMVSRKQWSVSGRKISLEDCLIAALGHAHRTAGGLSGVADADGVALFDELHLSIAIETQNGLMTPVLRHVERLSLEEIAVARRALVERALSGQLKVCDMKGGTFTLSNLGQTRVSFFTPILNGGQLGLLGVGSFVRRPSLEDGQLSDRAWLPLSLTADHRVVDGAPAGRFLTQICEYLEGAGPRAFENG